MISILALLSGGAVPVLAQTAGVQSAAAVGFDIPAQPLSDALYAYTAVTGVDILVSGNLLSQRRSSAVVGHMTPDHALRALLAGSGLVPSSTDARAFTLALAPQQTVSVAPRLPRHPQYSAAVQEAVTNALCQLRETQLGFSRLAVRLWVGSTGEVTRVGLLGSTGNTERDAFFAALFKGMIIDEPPPANLPQPTTVIVASGQDDTADCQGTTAGRTP